MDNAPITTEADARAYIDAVVARSNRPYTPSPEQIKALTGAGEHTWRSVEMALADALFLWRKAGNGDSPYARRIESVWLELFGDPTDSAPVEQQRAERAATPGPDGQA